MMDSPTTAIEFDYLDEKFLLVGNHQWLWESWEEPGDHHSLDSETWECTCPGFTYRKTCRHIDLLKELLDHHPTESSKNVSQDPGGANA